MRKVAFIVGIERYADPRMPKFPYASADAGAIARAFEPLGFSAADRVLLLDEKATRAVFEAAIRVELAELREGDHFLFYFAGHAYSIDGQTHLSACETRLDELAATGIALGTIVEGFTASAASRGIFFLSWSGSELPIEPDGYSPDPTIGEIERLIGATNRTVAFASCSPGETALASDRLKHGIWTAHLLDALSGRAPTALENGTRLTAKSLERFLRRETPATVRATYRRARQTPLFFGKASKHFLLADLATLQPANRDVGLPDERQFGGVRFFSERRAETKRLAGFLKSHHVPDRTNDSAQIFVARLATTELQDDMNVVRDRLRTAFGFKRKDITMRGPDANGGSILTPFFDYQVSVALAADDPSRIQWRREVTNIREPEPVMSATFDATFEGYFDSLEIPAGSPIDLENLVDRLEESSDSPAVDYDEPLTWCRVTVPGTATDLHFTADAVRLSHRTSGSPRALIQAFADFREWLAAQAPARGLPSTE